MNRVFSIVDRSGLAAVEFKEDREAAEKILSLVEAGQPVESLLNSGIIPSADVSTLIPKMVTKGIVSPQQDSPELNQRRKVVIVSDSAADLPQGFAELHDISVVPLRLSFGNIHFVDGVYIAADTFYKKLADSSELPVTSPPDS